MQDIMTEKDAKTKWCPMLRGSHDDGKTRSVAINAGIIEGKDVRIGKCIASDCMAWRLAHKDAADGAERGYCGAFGTPRFT